MWIKLALIRIGKFHPHSSQAAKVLPTPKNQ
jgi:hypothetical protein